MILDVVAPGPVPAQLLASLAGPRWSLWGSKAAHLAEAFVAWRVAMVWWLARKDDRRERHDRLQQRRGF